MGRLRFHVGVAILTVFCGRAAALDSLAGDADCDGFTLSGDRAAVTAEIYDGDSPLVEEIEGGDVFTCTGADANADGLVSAADLVSIARIPSVSDEMGPLITFLGVAAADGTVVGSAPGGLVPVYQRPGGLGFHLVVEAAPGASGAPVGQRVFNARVDDPTARPDLQIQFSRDLFAGSFNVCDENGVPRIFPPSFGPSQEIANALNDAACRFTVVSNPRLGCTMDSFGVHRFAQSQSRAQFCLAVSGAEAFPPGTTLVTVRALDVDGNPGPASQVLIHVGTGPPPTPLPTVTATGTRRPSPTPSSTAVATSTFSPTRTRTATGPSVSRTPTPTRTVTSRFSPTRTRTATATRTRSGTVPPTPTRIRTSPTPSTSPTSSRTRTRTPTRTPTTGFTPGTPTRTRRATATPTGTATLTRTRTRTQTVTPSASRTPSQTRTGTRTRTASRTPTASSTPTITRTPTQTRTMGPTARPGPEVNFLGLSRPDDRLLTPDDELPDGTPIYERPFGYGFNIIVEGKPGPSRRPVGRSSFNYVPGDPDILPDLQIIVSNGLGENPSRSVCDNIPGFIGGVPASPGFNGSQLVADAMNDFGCRFVDGDNRPLGRPSAEACILYPDGEFRFARSDSTVQFCAQIAVPLAFPVGETTVTARLRDNSGSTGSSKTMIVRIRP